MKRDQEDELYEKDVDEMIGFHVVDEDAEEEDDVTEEDELLEGVVDDDLPLEEDDEVVGDFGGKDFDFEHEEEES